MWFVRRPGLESLFEDILADHSALPRVQPLIGTYLLANRGTLQPLFRRETEILVHRLMAVLGYERNERIVEVISSHLITQQGRFKAVYALVQCCFPSGINIHSIAVEPKSQTQCFKWNEQTVKWKLRVYDK